MKYVILSLLWSGYCILHSFLISTSFTKYLSHLLKKYFAFYRLFYIIISVLLLIPLLNISADSEVIISYPAPWSYVRQVLMYGALLMFFWAFFFDYDSLSFFGIRQIIGFFKKEGPALPGQIKTGGLLGLTRHPMYLALIIILWCTIFTLTGLIINALLTVYVIIGTFLEERKLVLEFGNAYVEYKRQVPMIIPFTKRKTTSGRLV